MIERLSSDALVLRRMDYGEADRVVWLLTPSHGRLSAFAAGARRSKRRFAGALEPFTALTAQLTAPRRGDLWRLEEVQVIDSHGPLRQSLEALTCASVASELMAALSVESATPSHRGAGHYPLLLAYLRALSLRPTLGDDLYRFLLLALHAAGLRPELERCVRCGGDTPADGDLQHFDPAEGGRLCQGCPPRFRSGHRTSGRLLEGLRAFSEGQEPPSPEGRRLLWRYAEHHLGKPLKSLALLAELGL